MLRCSCPQKNVKTILKWPSAILGGLLLLLGYLDVQPAKAFVVEFPGPVPVDILGNSTAGVAIPWQADTGDYLVVGADNGFLNLVRLLSGSSNFNVFYRHYTGGEVVWLDTWENMPTGETGIVMATRNPDRVVFFQIQQSAPYFVPLHELDLPEDPGTFAFVGPAYPGGQELAITLPGVDQIAILKFTGQSWAISQILAAGDGPVYVVGLDLETDGVREVITADAGVLSRNLGFFRRDAEGIYSRTGQQSLSGWPQVIRTYDIDGDDRLELVVGYSDQAEILFMEAADGLLTASGSLALTLPADSIYLCPLPQDSIGLFTGVQERGLVEYFRGQADQWAFQESYYPSCRPSGLTAGDFNQDGLQDLVSLGTEALPTTVMFGNPANGFWGFPALTLNSAPGSSCLADFNLDGYQDLVVVGSEEPLLSFFLGSEDGGLAEAPVDQELEYLAGGLVSLEAGGSEGPELALVDFYTGNIRIMDFTPALGFQQLSSRQILPFPRQLHAADLDADGHDDLFMARRSISDLTVLYGDGQGDFSDQWSVTLLTGAEDACALDLNGDSLLDLLGVDGSSRVYSYLNQDDGTFGNGAWVSAGTGARFLATGDLDGDLDLDVVVGNRTEQSLTFLENDSSGTLVRRIGAHAISGTPVGLVCSDVDQSGTTDILINLGDEGNIGLVFGLGDWTFGSPIRFPGGVNIIDLLVGDFNLDGYPDVLNLDQSLQLGLTMLNLDRSLVAVDPSALAVNCDDLGLTVTIAPDRTGVWDLEIGWEDHWTTLVREVQPQLGRLDFDGRHWLLEVTWQEISSRLPPAGSGVSLRLAVGLDSDREYLALDLDSTCVKLGRPTALSLLDWDRDPWPNPFNPSIQSRISLSRAAWISAGVYDLSGRKVATLWEGNLEAGTHTLAWDGRSRGRATSAGMYFLRITGPQAVLSRKIVLLK